MVFSYVLSWLVNVLAWGIIVAIVDEGKGYGIEKIPEVPFLLAVGIPTLLELLAFTFEQKPFLAVIWPAFNSLI